MQLPLWALYNEVSMECNCIAGVRQALPGFSPASAWLRTGLSHIVVRAYVPASYLCSILALLQGIDCPYLTSQVCCFAAAAASAAAAGALAWQGAA
jgi:hypothetical protein